MPPSVPAPTGPAAPTGAETGVETDVVFGGTVFCDLVMSGTPLPGPGEEVFADGFALVPGGTANRAVATARLGMRTGISAVLGDDVLGEHVRTVLDREPGLDLRWLQRAPGRQTPVTVAVTNEHDRGFITYEEDGTGVPQQWPGALPSARAAHVGIARPLPGWVGRLRAAGTTVFGGVGWDGTGTWSPQVLRHAEEVDVFVLNDLEALNYTRTGSVEEAARVLTRHVRTVVITQGRDGVTALDAGAEGAASLVRVPAVPVRAVDPTGAGDVFTAGLMTGTVLGWDLRTRVAFAGLAATSSVRSLGGSLSAPRPGELLEFLAETAPEGDWSTVRDWLQGTATLQPT
ncbi:carbohydrate kinase family protein [Kineococcus sp. LSe6-4]|uniref:Carbohydrate kinase family protein n=1 Tax=Kineococcus halophytocola TaxID=3234027 RepID=A0ABV4H631_9ACTN